MAILKKILPVLPALLLTGCYEDFTPDVDVKPVLCLNSLIVAGQEVKVDVTHTWLYTDVKADKDHTVPDARLTIYVNGQPEPEGYLAREGDHIRIVAESDKYGTAEAEVTVPVAVVPTSLKWTATPINVWHEDLEGWAMNAIVDFNVNAELTINDPANVENYYEFSRFGYNKHFDDVIDDDELHVSWNPVSLSLGTFKVEFEPIFAEHIGDFEAISGSSVSDFNFFTDRSFSGGSYTLHLFFEGMEFFGRLMEYDDSALDCGLTLVLYTVSKSKYNWANYSWHVWEGMIGDFGDIGLGDPVWAYSNVSTGAGVVAAQSSASVVINLHDFLCQYFNNPQ